MLTFNDNLTAKWRDGGNLVLGLWLVVSPWVLAYAREATPAWNAHIVGLIIAVAAFAALLSFQEWEEWVNVVLGAWLIVSPFILGFSALAHALWNQLIVGALVLGLAAWAALVDRDKAIKT